MAITASELSTRLGNLNRKLSDVAVAARKKTIYGTLCRKTILRFYLLGWWKEIVDGYTVGSDDNSITETQLLNILNESEKIVV